jgi:hypothetical protein
VYRQQSKLWRYVVSFNLFLILLQAITIILESSRKQDVEDFSFAFGAAASPKVPTVGNLASNGMRGIIDPSERDMISVLSLHTAMQDGKIFAEEASLFLLHTAALQHLQLQNRWPSITAPNPLKELTCSFTLGAASLLRDYEVFEQLDLLKLPMDLADLLDGFLLASLARDVGLRTMVLANPAVKEKHKSLLGALVEVSGGSFVVRDVMRIVHESLGSQDLTSRSYSGFRNVQTVLPFKNAVFDHHLAPVHLRLCDRFVSGPPPDKAKVFQELSHWHNHKKAIATKGPTQKFGFFARRRNDFYTAEMHAYAASLTNAAGKILDPETIVVGQRVQPFKSQKAFAMVDIDSSHHVNNRVCSKDDKKTSKPRKSGKTAALVSDKKRLLSAYHYITPH